LVYNEQLADKVRALVARRKGVSEKKMFGGLAFLLHGNMCCGVLKEDLMVRVGAERHDKAAAMAHARTMDFTGRPMKGFIYVDSSGWSKDATLKKWVEMGIDHASSLPRKR
jgi:TfoX/Sxy family transcriptional regulator of competence genes